MTSNQNVYMKTILCCRLSARMNHYYPINTISVCAQMLFILYAVNARPYVVVSAEWLVWMSVRPCLGAVWSYNWCIVIRCMNKMIFLAINDLYYYRHYFLLRKFISHNNHINVLVVMHSIRIRFCFSAHMLGSRCINFNTMRLLVRL